MPNKYFYRKYSLFKQIDKKIRNSRDFHFALIVFVLGLLFRYIHWVCFGSKVISFPVGIDNSLYASALKDHFFEYIYYYHTKPIGIPISDYLSLIIFGSISKGHFLIVSFLDSLAPAFILAILLKLKLPRLYSLVIVSTWSLGLISWEFWRWGGHYDHFNVFLFSFYGWALYSSYQSPDINKNLMFGISSGLLILFNSLAPFIVFVTLLFWGPRLMFKEKRLLIFRALIPIMVFLIVGGKNYIQFGVPTTSTISGQNMMLFTGLAKGISVDEQEHSKFVEFVYNNKYPEWWIWCFNSSMEQGAQTDVDRFIQTNYGKCCGTLGEGYNFDLLEEKLKKLGEINLLSIIQKDKNTLLTKPWLFHGGVNESNTRFSVEYGKISAKVWKDFLLKEPIEFGKQFIKTIKLFVRGVTFLGENKYEPQHKIRSNVVRVSGYAIVPFLLVGIISAFNSLVFYIINVFTKHEKLVSHLRKYKIFNGYNKLFILLWIFTSVINLRFLLQFSSGNPWVLNYSFKYILFISLYLFSVFLIILYLNNLKIRNYDARFFGYAGYILLVCSLLGYLALKYTGILQLSFPTILIFQFSLMICWIISGKDKTDLFSMKLLNRTYSSINNQRMLVITSIILVSYSSALNMLTFGENERMFVSISPMALIIGGYYSYYILCILRQVINYLTSMFNVRK